MTWRAAVQLTTSGRPDSQLKHTSQTSTSQSTIKSDDITMAYYDPSMANPSLKIRNTTSLTTLSMSRYQAALSQPDSANTQLTIATQMQSTAAVQNQARGPPVFPNNLFVSDHD
ncbi:hypothetical protein FGSG_12268, partial [Fusarium graminearum PH-1]|uniref:hypothetical protein n=1 Tax=Gibberella zeae (strain ATCC MYA-4620 / CBS 123657 / FGSC 9075 / NRRL 31084 / PH-1) TaxID=229533 RepID=UPI0003CB21B5